MRKLIASTFVSVDGFTTGPGDDMTWVSKTFNDEMGKYAGDLMESMDVILLGRLTYQIMAAAWPFQTEATSPGADKMNNNPKIVLSRSLKTADWGTYNNVTLLHDNVADEIRKLKALPGKNIVIYGSANTVQGLTHLGLIDEYQLLVHPVVLGGEKPLFSGISQGSMPRLNLKLQRTQAFKNGVVVLYYQPERK